MTEEHSEAREEIKAGKNKSSSLIIILIVVFVLLLAAGGAAGYFIFVAPKDKAQAPQPQQAPVAQDAESMAAAGMAGPIKPLDSFIVNLTDAQGTRYLKVVMELEMSNEILGTEIDRKNPQIRDEIIMLLSSKSFDDVSSIAGKRALKRGILNSINKSLATGKVVRIYFSEFVVQ